MPGMLVGDSKQRVTVPMPGTINELRSQAHRHFRNGHGLFLHGMEPISHGGQMKDIKNNDVVIVKGLKEKSREAPPVTTHAAHYVKHDMEAPPSFQPRQAPSTPTRFEGKTSYDCDYVEHPLEPKQPWRPVTSQWPRKTDGPLGTSTYSQHYPWHDAQPPAQMRQAPPPKSRAPFDGVTSYGNDYVKHPLRPRTPTQTPPRPVNSGPFEGATTYGNDFHKHDPQPTRPIGHHGTLRPSTAPFDGSTEYNKEYLKHPLEKPLIIHIEPEARRARRNHRSDSAPASSSSSSSYRH